MKRIYLISMILASFLIILSCNILLPDAHDPLNTEEHAIIYAVIDSVMSSPDSMLIYDLTDSLINDNEISIGLEHDSIAFHSSLLESYRNANQIRRSLNDDLLPDNVYLQDAQDPEPYSGITWFTRPGISDDGLMAIVEYSSISAPLCGIGMVALLEKQDGVWRMIWHQMIWIS